MIRSYLFVTPVGELLPKLKISGVMKIIQETSSGSSPKSGLFNHTSFSPLQTGAPDLFPLNSTGPSANLKYYTNFSSFIEEKSRKMSSKGIVRRNLRWVMSGINCQLLLYCSGAYIFIYLKGSL
jgi:hypothetical protein